MKGFRTWVQFPPSPFKPIVFGFFYCLYHFFLAIIIVGYYNYIKGISKDRFKAKRREFLHRQGKDRNIGVFLEVP